MKKLDSQGCGTIRIIYPYLLLPHFKQKGVKIHSTYLHTFTPDSRFYGDTSFIQFQRASEKMHFDMIKELKGNLVRSGHKIPIVYEIDDDIFNIPEWNYASEFYGKSKEYIKKIIASCDFVITSTEHLKKLYQPFNPDVSVILNHLPKFVWGETYPKHLYEPREKKPRILWAGSQNHFSDGKRPGGGDFGSKLMKFIIKTTDIYDWCFIGALPVELNGIKNKITYKPWCSVFEYPCLMKELDPDIGIAPLQHIMFNRSKSNIKQLEFAATGAVGVFTDIEPYEKATAKCKTEEEMIDWIERLAKDVDLRGKIYNKDMMKIENQMFWEEGSNLKDYINTYLKHYSKKI